MATVLTVGKNKYSVTLGDAEADIVATHSKRESLCVDDALAQILTVAICTEGIVIDDEECEATSSAKSESSCNVAILEYNPEFGAFRVPKGCELMAARAVQGYINMVLTDNILDCQKRDG